MLLMDYSLYIKMKIINYKHSRVMVMIAVITTDKKN